MWNSEQKNIWQDIKDTWNDQPESEKITFFQPKEIGKHQMLKE